jgi:hypothetical protein
MCHATSPSKKRLASVAFQRRHSPERASAIAHFWSSSPSTSGTTGDEAIVVTAYAMKEGGVGMGKALFRD